MNQSDSAEDLWL